jgi:hypothetical protein
MDEYDSDYLTVTAPEGYISGLTPCYHKDRFVVLVEACMSPDCRSSSIASDDIFEFTFEHPSGKRAVQCLSKPKVAFVSAGRVAAAVIGGAISASLGSSVAGSISGSTAGSAGGAIALIGTVQFIALLSDNCGAQADSGLQDFLTLLAPLQTFNLRVPMPDIPIFTPVKEWRLAADISLCGAEGVDLVNQARADEGALFEANAVIGLMVVAIATALHVLLLLPPFPRYREVVMNAAPFGKLQTVLLLTAFPGLLVSSFRMISIGEPVCKYAGFVLLGIPSLTMLFVIYILMRYVRPSSSERLVKWDDDKAEWASVTSSELPVHASWNDVGILKRTSPMMSISMRLSKHVKESTDADFLSRYAPLFDGYLCLRGAWLAVPLILVQQYVMAAFLGLAVPYGDCYYEQVRMVSSSL